MTRTNDCFMGILSCKKYQSRRDQQDLSGSIFGYLYFIGDPKLTEAKILDNIVFLPCEDGYEYLPHKTREMLRWILQNKPEVKFIFKTDDDIRFNFGSLSENYKHVLNNMVDYSGNVVNTNGYVSTYHFGKCDSNINEKVVRVGKASYCSGGGYFLSRRSAEIIVGSEIKEYIIFEDHFVGKELNDHNIFPKHIELHNVSCFW